ncbi:tegument protein TRS1 [Human betaherpesvirus 5]|uniref:Tegument protein TRS1 n=1 Tax=Human cytomegalovirus TaxID=10359 RepID=A0A0G2TQB8_HCMV|nr:tegument protein TRS1 [Human betaherpesvirus 5]AKI23964.1 tegument protein TRS1 [Human betaherpesvirus 5]
MAQRNGMSPRPPPLGRGRGAGGPSGVGSSPPSSCVPMGATSTAGTGASAAATATPGHGVHRVEPRGPPGAPPSSGNNSNFWHGPERLLLSQIPVERQALTELEYQAMGAVWRAAFLANSTGRAMRKWSQRDAGTLLPLGRPYGFYARVTPRSQMNGVGATDLRQLSPRDAWIVLVATVVHEVDPAADPTVGDKAGHPEGLCAQDGLYLALGAGFRVFVYDLANNTLILAARDADEWFRHGAGEVVRLYRCNRLGVGTPRATLLPQPALRQTLLRAEEATALGRELRRRWAGTTVALQTPGRRLQPMVLLGAWQELAQYEPFASAPHPASLLTAVRRHLNQRLCCGWLALGAVLPSRWLGCAAGPATGTAAGTTAMATGTTLLAGASGTETEAAGGDAPCAMAGAVGSAVPVPPQPYGASAGGHAVCVPNADAHTVVGADAAAAAAAAAPTVMVGPTAMVGPAAMAGPAASDTVPRAMLVVLLDELGAVFGYCPLDGHVYPLAAELSHFLRAGVLGALALGRESAPAAEAARRLLPELDREQWERPRWDALHLHPRAALWAREPHGQLAFLLRPGRGEAEVLTLATKHPAICANVEDYLQDARRRADAQALGLDLATVVMEAGGQMIHKKTKKPKGKEDESLMKGKHSRYTRPTEPPLTPQASLGRALRRDDEDWKPPRLPGEDSWYDLDETFWVLGSNRKNDVYQRRWKKTVLRCGLEIDRPMPTVPKGCRPQTFTHEGIQLMGGATQEPPDTGLYAPSHVTSAFVPSVYMPPTVPYPDPAARLCRDMRRVTFSNVATHYHYNAQ